MCSSCPVLTVLKSLLLNEIKSKTDDLDLSSGSNISVYDQDSSKLFFQHLKGFHRGFFVMFTSYNDPKLQLDLLS